MIDESDFSKLAERFEKEFFMFRRKAIWSFLGGALAFAAAAGFISYKAALESLHSKPALQALENIRQTKTDVEADAKAIKELRKKLEDADQLIPKGTIVAWFGTGGIPRGWALCDGNGNPSLKDRFLRGTTQAKEVGKTGGSDTHSHSLKAQTSDLTTSQHHGDLPTSQGLAHGSRNHSHTVIGNTSSDRNVPQYLSVFFIIKL